MYHKSRGKFTTSKIEVQLNLVSEDLDLVYLLQQNIDIF